MEHNSTPTQRTLQIPPIVWFLGIGMVIALIAIFIFNVAVSTVAYFGLFAFMIGSHFFMHGSHAGHGGQRSHAGHQPGIVSNLGDADNDEHAGHSGGCH
jgi:hypothetical protein